MRRFSALLHKDYLLLVRDVAGLCLLFVMPVALVFLMTFLQDDLLDRINKTGVSVLMLNMDNDTLGNSIEQQIGDSESFAVTKTEKSETELRYAVARGDYMIGIVIPQHTSDSIRANAERIVFSGFTGEETEPSTPVSIRIYIDPTLSISFRNTLMSTITGYSAITERDFLLHELLTAFSGHFPLAPEAIRFDGSQMDFDVQYAFRGEKIIIPNSAQHNVPAWTLFAIFFITLPLAVSLINERKDGSFMRLLTMPCSYFEYLLSKIVVFLVVCLLQFTLIFALGVYLFPHIGLPALTLGENAWLLLPMSISSALAAIGFGIFIGKVTSDHQQAVVFASLSVVISAAIGGIWVPTFAMPAIMQTISQISPLNWGLSGFYDILIRNGTFADILWVCLYSIGFAAICVTIALVYHRKKQL